MGDLTKFTPEESATVQAIYAWWQKREENEPSRGYLGASQIGIECDRQLWYAFRLQLKEPFDGRMLRLFNRGHREEAVFVEELRGIGCEVHETDPDGNQFALSALGGHFSGHMDGAALGVPEAPKTWHVCEFKTHNDKSFNHLKANGVQKSKPQHYQQMMVYMGLSGMTRALYLAVNKDTDELYSERVRYNASEFNAIMLRAKRIIETCTAPERIATRADDWRCKFCPFHTICWGQLDTALPPNINPRSCRTCCHATAKTDDEGGWYCERHKMPLQNGQLKIGCDNHLLLPSLLYGCSPTDATNNSVTYTTDVGITFTQGKGHWTVEELMRTHRDAVGEKPADNTPPSLIERYIWTGKQIWLGEVALLEQAIGDYLPGLGITEKEVDEVYVAVQYGDNHLVVAYDHNNRGAIWQKAE